MNNNNNKGKLIILRTFIHKALIFSCCAATNIGGGYINGTAESVAFDGLLWTQAPVCYAISLCLSICLNMLSFYFSIIYRHYDCIYHMKIVIITFLLLFMM